MARTSEASDPVMGAGESSTLPEATGGEPPIELVIQFPLASVTDDALVIDLDKEMNVGH